MLLKCNRQWVTHAAVAAAAAVVPTGWAADIRDWPVLLMQPHQQVGQWLRQVLLLQQLASLSRSISSQNHSGVLKAASPCWQGRMPGELKHSMCLLIPPRGERGGGDLMANSFDRVRHVKDHQGKGPRRYEIMRKDCSNVWIIPAMKNCSETDVSMINFKLGGHAASLAPHKHADHRISHFCQGQALRKDFFNYICVSLEVGSKPILRSVSFSPLLSAPSVWLLHLGVSGTIQASVGIRHATDEQIWAGFLIATHCTAKISHFGFWLWHV